MLVLRKIADVLAVVFHPVFLFFYITLTVGAFLYVEQWKWLSIIFLGTVFLPIIVVALFGDIHLRKQTSRRIPLVLVSLCYIGTYVFLSHINSLYIVRFYKGELPFIRGDKFIACLPVYHFILQNLLAITLGICILTIVNFWSKASLHAGGLGFVLIFLIKPFFEPGSILPGQAFSYSLGTIPIAIICVIVPLVLWQRIKSGAHSVSEIVVGLMIGILTSAFSQPA